MKITCPLCHSKDLTTFRHIGKRKFHCCRHCKLIFADPAELPSPELEKNRYLQHHNNIHNKDYVAFLKQAISPSLPFIVKGSTGLDFGCGPDAVLSQLLVAEGLNCKNYDPFFFPEVPAEPLDFIFSTECFEHFHRPQKEVENISRMLKPGGFLIMMTAHYPKGEIHDWWYMHDFTHVSFYTSSTFEFIAHQYKYDIVYNDQNRVVIFKKN